MPSSEPSTIEAERLVAPTLGSKRETPDIETSSEDYARRFSGAAGEYFLEVQAQAFEYVMRGLSSSSVLDVGGGHAQLVPSFLRLNCRLTVFGSDGSTHARMRSRFPGENIELATGDLLELPFPDRSFDVAVAMRLIAHVDAWETLISELCRVARHSVIIDYPSWRSLNALTPVLFPFKKAVEGNTRPYASFFSSRLDAEFRRHSFNPAASYNQFVLPMFVHRGFEGARGLKLCERVFRRFGMTSLLGSPVVLRMDRSPRLVRTEELVDADPALAATSVPAALSPAVVTRRQSREPRRASVDPRNPKRCNLSHHGVRLRTGGPRMKCPIDDTQLVMSERQGIEIDYCPQCRGVWLDRGELDKIIDRSAAERREEVPASRHHHERDSHDSHDSHRRYPKRKRESFLSDLFDF